MTTDDEKYDNFLLLLFCVVFCCVVDDKRMNEQFEMLLLIFIFVEDNKCTAIKVRVGFIVCFSGFFLRCFLFFFFLGLNSGCVSSGFRSSH